MTVAEPTTVDELVHGGDRPTDDVDEAYGPWELSARLHHHAGNAEAAADEYHAIEMFVARLAGKPSR